MHESADRAIWSIIINHYIHVHEIYIIQFQEIENGVYICKPNTNTGERLRELKQLRKSKIYTDTLHSLQHLS